MITRSLPHAALIQECAELLDEGRLSIECIMHDRYRDYSTLDRRNFHDIRSAHRAYMSRLKEAAEIYYGASILDAAIGQMSKN